MAPPVSLPAPTLAPVADGDVATACQFCNSLCGMVVTRDHGRIVGLHGRTDDPVQRGQLCVKGPMMTQLVDDPRRITSPLRRISGDKGSRETRFEPIDWDTALDEIARRFLALRDSGEVHTVAARTTGRMVRGTGPLVGRFFSLLGSPNNADVGPVCNDAGANALAATFGLGVFTNGYGLDGVTGCEDLGAAEYVLMIGSNQAETHPVTFDYVQRARRTTGAPLVVVDPRRTRTAEGADRWVGVRPHTDLAFALGLLGEVVGNDLVDHQFVARWTTGYQQLREHLRSLGYDAGWAAAVCGVDADDLRAIARDYASRRPAAIYCNAGVSHQLTAFHTYRALAMLAAVTGNIGVDGAGCNFMHNTWPGALELPPPPDRAGPPAVTGLPLGPDAFAEAILSGDPYPIKALLGSGNPVIASANSGKNERAYRELEYYVYTGLFLEEAAYYADIVLPVCSGLELDGVYMRRDDRAVRWQHRAADRIGQARTDAEIWIALAHAMGRNDTVRGRDYWADAFPVEWLDFATLWDTFVAHTPGMRGMGSGRLAQRAEPLRWPCPRPDHPGFSALYLDHPDWYDTVQAHLHPGGERVRFPTASGLVELWTPGLDDALAPAGHQALPVYYGHPELRDGRTVLQHERGWVTNPIDSGAITRRGRMHTPTAVSAEELPYPLTGVIGRAGVVHFATLTQWTRLGKQLTGVRLIQIHTTTAARFGIRDGDDVRVTSLHGQVDGTAQVIDGIRPDTVYVPNSFGDGQDTTQGRPQYRSANALVDDSMFDNLSGQQAYKCFSCNVSLAPVPPGRPPRSASAPTATA